MSTTIFYHPSGLDHDTGRGHPERPDRLRAVKAALEEEEFASLTWETAPEATRDQLLLAHPEEYVDRIQAAIPTAGLAALDGDTIISPGSGEAALRAAGAGCAAVDAVVAGRTVNAFCAMRPPGHHAEADKAMGFCLYSNAAIAALHARRRHGLERVAVVDFDVHHGNGTQDIFYDDPHLFYASTHESPLFPGTGAESETGVANNILNVPHRSGADGSALREALAEKILPALDLFEPELLIISAGFDAHSNDPLASSRFEVEDFAFATSALAGMAEKHCARRIVSVLEGGYDLEALAISCAAHVRVLMRAGQVVTENGRGTL